MFMKRISTLANSCGPDVASQFKFHTWHVCANWRVSRTVITGLWLSTCVKGVGKGYGKIKDEALKFKLLTCSTKPAVRTAENSSKV